MGCCRSPHWEGGIIDGIRTQLPLPNTKSPVFWQKGGLWPRQGACHQSRGWGVPGSGSSPATHSLLLWFRWAGGGGDTVPQQWVGAEAADPAPQEREEQEQGSLARGKWVWTREAGSTTGPPCGPEQPADPLWASVLSL